MSAGNLGSAVGPSLHYLLPRTGSLVAYQPVYEPRVDSIAHVYAIKAYIRARHGQELVISVHVLESSGGVFGGGELGRSRA